MHTLAAGLPRRAFGRLAAGLVALPHATYAAPPRQRVPIGLFSDAHCPVAPYVARFGQWLGHRIDLGLDFIDIRYGWDKFISSAESILGCWSSTHLPIVLSMPMLMQEPRPSLRRGAAGEYDAHFRSLARLLVLHRHERAILRVGWEFNGNWYHWAAERDPDAFVAYWRRIVGIMRGVPDARFRFDWNPAVLGSGPVDRVYPGDNVVDIIGLNTYNQCWPFIADPAQRWRYLMDYKSGLRWHRDFAATHGKPRSFPEWGTGTRPDGHGGGDDPLFVRNMLAWMQDGGPVVYACYWNSASPDWDGHITDGRMPAAAAALRTGLADRN